MLGKVSKGKLFLKSLVRFQKRASLLISPKSAEVKRHIKGGFYNFEEGLLVPYMSKVKVYSFFKTGKLESVKVIIHTRTPGMIIGKGGKQINRLEEYLSRLTGAPVKIGFKEINVLQDIYDTSIVGNLSYADTFGKKVKWLFGKEI